MPVHGVNVARAVVGANTPGTVIARRGRPHPICIAVTVAAILVLLGPPAAHADEPPPETHTNTSTEEWKEQPRGVQRKGAPMKGGQDVPMRGAKDSPARPRFHLGGEDVGQPWWEQSHATGNWGAARRRNSPRLAACRDWKTAAVGRYTLSSKGLPALRMEFLVKTPSYKVKRPFLCALKLTLVQYPG